MYGRRAAGGRVPCRFTPRDLNISVHVLRVGFKTVRIICRTLGHVIIQVGVSLQLIIMYNYIIIIIIIFTLLSESLHYRSWCLISICCTYPFLSFSVIHVWYLHLHIWSQLKKPTCVDAIWLTALQKEISRRRRCTAKSKQHFAKELSSIQVESQEQRRWLDGCSTDGRRQEQDHNYS